MRRMSARRAVSLSTAAIAASAAMLLAVAGCEHRPRGEGDRPLPSLSEAMSKASNAGLLGTGAAVPPGGAGGARVDDAIKTPPAADTATETPPMPRTAPDDPPPPPTAAVDAAVPETPPVADAGAAVVPPAQPKGDAVACGKVGDHLTKLMKAEEPNVPEEQLEEFRRNLALIGPSIRDTCVENNWPPAMTDCVTRMKAQEDFVGCRAILGDAMLERALAAPQAPGEPSCVAVMKHVFQLIAGEAAAPEQKAQLEQSRSTIQNDILTLCNEEPWSIEARKCFMNAKTADQQEECTKLVKLPG
jgi:hypothetical protein